jgi:hypothetical protein
LSLTINGYAFDEGSDPITPEMISAAPKYHASESPEYGVGTVEKYGHFKLADLGDFFTPAEDGALLDLPPEIADADDIQEVLKPYALSAYTGFVGLNILMYSVTDIDNLVMTINESVHNLRLEVVKLRNEVDALKGGS